MAVVSLAGLFGTSGCKTCEEGYEKRDDGICHATVVVGQETWDTGSSSSDGVPGTQVNAVVQGEVRPGDVDLAAAEAITVELWIDQDMDIYGPDREQGALTQEFSVDLETLKGGGAAEFSGEHPGIPLRGRDVFMFVRVDFSDRPAPAFFEAEANPYLLWQEEESDPVVIPVDSSTAED
jgi:hypothetical protein